MTKQQTIITTALSLFSKYGYHSIGVDKIRDEANVSKMTMYKYFPSKEILIENVLKYRDKDFREQWQQAIDSEACYLTQLEAIFNWHQQWFKQKDFYGCLFIKANEEFPDHAIIRTIAHNHKKHLQQLIERILQKGKIDQVAKLAEHITSVLEGLIIMNNMNKNALAVQTHWEYVKELIQCRQQ